MIINIKLNDKTITAKHILSSKAVLLYNHSALTHTSAFFSAVQNIKLIIFQLKSKL